MMLKISRAHIRVYKTSVVTGTAHMQVYLKPVQHGTAHTQASLT